jgi:hypothetical protein
LKAGFEAATAGSSSALERICSEVNSKCGSLRAASRLLPDLSARESEEMLLLMTEEALRLAKVLEEHRRDALGR